MKTAISALIFVASAHPYEEAQPVDSYKPDTTNYDVKDVKTTYPEPPKDYAPPPMDYDVKKDSPAPYGEYVPDYDVKSDVDYKKDDTYYPEDPYPVDKKVDTNYDTTKKYDGQYDNKYDDKKTYDDKKYDPTYKPSYEEEVYPKTPASVPPKYDDVKSTDPYPAKYDTYPADYNMPQVKKDCGMIYANSFIAYIKMILIHLDQAIVDIIVKSCEEVLKYYDNQGDKYDVDYDGIYATLETVKQVCTNTLYDDPEAVKLVTDSCQHAQDTYKAFPSYEPYPEYESDVKKIWDDVYDPSKTEYVKKDADDVKYYMDMYDGCVQHDEAKFNTGKEYYQEAYPDNKVVYDNMYEKTFKTLSKDDDGEEKDAASAESGKPKSSSARIVGSLAVISCMLAMLM